jgi:hypothetical protein
MTTAKALTKGLLDLEGWTNVILKRANEGEGAALVELRELCEGHPELWAGLGNLAAQAQAMLINVIAGPNEVVAEAVGREAAMLRRDLTEVDATPLERLLVARIVACWLHLHYAEARYAQNIGKITMPQGEYHQRTVERTERRYLAAVKALVQVRRLRTPSVQVNIAEAGGQQINLSH